ncbi:MAG: response regulator [Candidatus Eremiobacteraeota bacterium]|nr:response regulator [Candidatus Eremiobacteraeota bacterium]
MAAARIVRVGGQEADRASLETLLQGAGHTDVRFVTPAAAVEIVAGKDADLILLDLMLSSADVFAVLRAAQPAGNGNVHRIPVIVTAPYSAADRVAACLQRGAEDFILTPFDEQFGLLVTRRISLCLQRRQMREFTLRVQSSTSDPDETAFMQVYSDASSRFVPREFLENLGRNSLAEVKLGDHVERCMTVFFADIRDFTSLSEQMTPQENFNFLNSYLREVTPVIRAHNGFVDKYIGDGIMALFPGAPTEALSAAVEIQKRLGHYNLGRQAAGYPPIRIGIGLHYGDLILGTIGENERMQTTVISDVVNVASRIEGLNKTFGTSLLVSGTVVEQLQEPGTFKLRRLSDVKAKGKRKSVQLYECFDNDPQDVAEEKISNARVFEAGMEEFRKGMFLTAGKIFSRIAEISRRDVVAAYYRDRCTLDAVRDRGRERWDGAEKISVK